tara:strand:+ start:14664 stop:15362 length:699 start_codon:yes stop_codon:yes gene_type:complete
MIRKLFSEITKKLGRENYHPDKSISTVDILLISVSKSIQLFRGCWLKLFVKKSTGLIFLGTKVRIKFKRKISLGRTIQIGDYVEINALSKHGIVIGDNVSILRNTIIECTGVIRNLGEGLVIGNNVGIAQNCFIQVRGKVIIGNNVIFGPNVSIFSENHNYNDPDLPISVQGETRKGVRIEDGVWLGTRVVILDGVTVGENSIVAAGSVVNKDIAPYSIVGGVPAQFIKYRK